MCSTLAYALGGFGAASCPDLPLDPAADITVDGPPIVGGAFEIELLCQKNVAVDRIVSSS